MQKLVVVRHGSVGEDNHLSADGQREVVWLGRSLASAYGGGCKIRLLSSDTPHACESAEILGNLLQIPYTYHEELWCDAGHQDLKGVLKLVTSCEESDVLVLVTHREYTGDFPNFFAKKKWRKGVRAHRVPCATGWALDCDKRTLAYLH